MNVRAVIGRSLLALLVMACHAAPTAQPAPNKEVATRIDVRVDRRVELVAVVMRLAGNPEYNQAPSTSYVLAADAWFRPYRDHAVVVASKELAEKYEISFNAPMELALHLDDALQPHDIPDLRVTSPRWSKVDIDGYAAALRDFARVSRFDEFFAAHRAYYATVADKLRAAVDAEKPLEWFDARFGKRRGTFLITPAFLVGPWNYAARATRADGSVDALQVLGVWKAHGQLDIDDDTISLLVHEMAHTYINPVLDRHVAELAASGKVIYPLVARRLTKVGYDSWKIVVDESGVRATVAGFFRDRKGVAAGAKRIRTEQRAGFVWMDELFDVFARIPNGELEAHVADIAKFFDDYAARHANGLQAGPFVGPVDAAIYGDPVFVTPSDSEGARLLTALRDRVDPKALLVAASDDILSAHTGKDIVLYGGASEPAIAAVLARAGWQVDAAGISIAGQHFDGPHLVLIACVPRPDDPTHGIVVYTAADIRDVGDLGIWHGNTDWYVVRKTELGYDPIKGDNF